MPQHIFICADHGLALIYFLKSDVLSTLLEADLEVVLLTDDALVEGVQQRFGRDRLTIEGLRLPRANAYANQNAAELQWWGNFLRRVGTSNRINTQAMDSYVQQVSVEAGRKRRLLMPLARAILSLLRRSQRARQALVNVQKRYNPMLYADLLDRYQPQLVVASTYGWRQDRYLLREAEARGTKIAAVIVGWDNPSSYGLPAARIDEVTCWSEIQKDELTLGGPWHADRVSIGGIPSYDGYFRHEWLMPRDEYFRLHGLSPERKLLSYAASFVSFAPNFRNVETLALLVASNDLVAPTQLLIRLHPNHFMDNPLYAREREKIHQLAQELPYVHVVEPVPLGGSLSYYSGEDMPEKSSMMAYSDVFLTVYSTMVVECGIHDRPIVSVCLDTPGGWNTPQKFSLPLSQIGDWPTHSRFRASGGGRVALDESQLIEAINRYLQDPAADLEHLRSFIRQECTYTDGSAGKRSGEWLASLL
jgi:hypothetical protein